MNKYGIIFLLLGFLLLSACHNQTIEPETETLEPMTLDEQIMKEDDITMENEEIILENEKILLRDISIEEDKAKTISRILASLNVQKINHFKVKKQNESVYEIIITDSLEYTYFLVINKEGMLDTLRENNKKGRIVYSNTISHNQNIIKKLLSIDSLSAWQIAGDLNTLNVQKISDFVVEKHMESGGYCVRIVDILGDAYFLIINRRNKLVRVHKNSWKEESIYDIIA